MSNLVIKRVDSRREHRQFLDFPWQLYAGDPKWIPPLRENQKELTNYVKHPFYDRNRLQLFLAYRGNQVCGRIAAILNQGHIHYHNDLRGFFGFFECIDDQEAANGLFDAVRDWFAEQDIHAVRGPANPSLNYEVGLLIEGFDSPPTFMMTYNPLYYQRLVEGYGFRKAQDMYAFWGHVEMLPQIHAKLEPISLQIIERYNVRLRPLDTAHFRDDVRMFLDIYNRSLFNTWGFVPMSDAEMEHMADGLKYLMVPELAVAAEVDGKVVGATFGLPDYNPRIKEIDGRLFPFGFLRLLRRKHDIKRIRVISTNVLPEYQRMGIGLTLMHGLMPKAMAWNLQEAEFSWVLESNALSRGSLAKGGAKLTKTYRVYDYDARANGNGGPDEPAATIAIHPAVRAAASAPAVRAGRSSALEIREVQSGADLERFIDVPEPIYARDPHWITPLRIEVKEFLNPRKHPFYQHGAATKFLALRDGVPVGRILTADDPNYNRQWNTSVGTFGMFECADDEEAAHGLLDAAAGWLKARGRTAVFGPIDYSTNYPCGLLVAGFHTPPRVMMNHGRPYYAGLLESWGLVKCKDLFAWWFTDPHDAVAKYRQRIERLAQRSGVTVRPFRKSDFNAEVERCQSVYNAATGENWGSVKLTRPEFQFLAQQLGKIANPEQVLLAEVEGQTVGFSATVPDVNEAIAPLNGRLMKWGLPLNIPRLLYRMRHVTTARMLVLDVLEKYRRRGIAELMILRTLDFGKNKLGYTGAELGWTLEDNVMVTRTVERVGGRPYKTYRIYEKAL